MKYKSKESFTEPAILCDAGCGRDIQGKYIRVECGSGFYQNYHVSCNKKIETLTNNGYEFFRRQPEIVLINPIANKENICKIRQRDGVSNVINPVALKAKYQKL